VKYALLYTLGSADAITAVCDISLLHEVLLLIANLSSSNFVISSQIGSGTTRLVSLELLSSVDPPLSSSTIFTWSSQDSGIELQ
jgi:hypothetical protein